MARDEFDSAGEYVQVSDLLGELLLITPIEYIEEFVTSFSPEGTDVVRADVAILNKDGSYTEHDDVMIFQGALIGTLKRKLTTTTRIDRDPVTGVVTNYATTSTKRVLGVLGKGEGKKGQNPPYVLVTPTDEQKALARTYIADNPLPAPVEKVVSQQLVLPGTAPAAGPVGAAPAAPVSTPWTPPPAAESSPAATADDPWAVSE